MQSIKLKLMNFDLGSWVAVRAPVGRRTIILVDDLDRWLKSLPQHDGPREQAEAEDR